MSDFSFLDENTDIHHVFPRAYCEGTGLKREKWNSIVNKTPLFARTNRILGGNAPSEYLNKIEKDNKVIGTDLDKYIESHKIDISAIRTDDFENFFVSRAKNLLDLIGGAMGKTISNRDSEETVAVFGKSL